MTDAEELRPGDTESTNAEDVSSLRGARDAAVHAAQTAFRDFARLTRILTILNEPAPADRLLDKALSTLSELFLSDIVVLLDPVGTGGYTPSASTGLPEQISKQPFSDAADGCTATVMRTGAPIIVAGAGADPRVDRQLRELGAETATWLPVAGSQVRRGALILVRCRPLPFTQAEVDLLSSLSYQVGLALERGQRSAQLEEVVRYGGEIGRHLDESTIGTQTVRSFAALVRAAGAALVLSRPPEAPLRCVATDGLDASWVAALSGLAASLLADPGFGDDEPYAAADRAALERLPSAPPAPGAIRALLAVPIRGEGRQCGVLFALRFVAGAFSPDCLQMARLFGGQTSAALQNAVLYQAARTELAERLRAEEDRGRLQAELAQAQKMEALGTFAGGIAHDFNNLLHVVIGNIELALLKLGTTSEPAIEVLESLRAATQAADLTRKFLTFSSAVGLRKQRVDLKTLILDAVSLSLSGSSVGAEYRLPDGLWELDLDPVQVKQAIGSIVANAREAMPDGGTVTVTAENVGGHPDAGRGDGPKRKGRYVSIVVADQGKGIPGEHLPRIFDPYFSTKARGAVRGMGLGLAVARSVITHHGGSIHVESQPSRGTSVEIRLPASATRRAEKTPVAAAGTGPARRAIRLLLLEDEDAVASTTIEMLRLLGYRDVARTREGTEAIRCFAGAWETGVPFELAILDLTVKGGMGGKETLRALLQISPTVKAVVSSGYSSDPVVSDFRVHGFRAALRKPFGLEDLKAALELALTQ
jgi:signal transduction histidine kinase